MGSHSQLPVKKTVMSSIETLSPGVAQSGVADQYADGVCPKLAPIHWRAGEQDDQLQELPDQPAEGEEVLHHSRCYLRHWSRLCDADRGDGSDPCLLSHLLRLLGQDVEVCAQAPLGT